MRANRKSNKNSFNPIASRIGHQFQFLSQFFYSVFRWYFWSFLALFDAIHQCLHCIGSQFTIETIKLSFLLLLFVSSVLCYGVPVCVCVCAQLNGGNSGQMRTFEQRCDIEIIEHLPLNLFVDTLNHRDERARARARAHLGNQNVIQQFGPCIWMMKCPLFWWPAHHTHAHTMMTRRFMFMAAPHTYGLIQTTWSIHVRMASTHRRQNDMQTMEADECDMTNDCVRTVHGTTKYIDDSSNERPNFCCVGNSRVLIMRKWVRFTQTLMSIHTFAHAPYCFPFNFADRKRKRQNNRCKDRTPAPSGICYIIRNVHIIGSNRAKL